MAKSKSAPTPTIAIEEDLIDQRFNPTGKRLANYNGALKIYNSLLSVVLRD